MTIQYIDINELSAKLAGRSTRSIQRDLKVDQLPKPYRISGRLVWDEAEVDRHIAEQSNKPIPTERIQNMKTPLQAAQDAMQIVSTNFTAQRNDLNALQAQLRKAPEHNAELIEAQANALAEGLEAPEGDLIDVKTVQQAIDVKHAVMVKLTAKLEDARLAVKDANSVLLEHKKRDARHVLIKRFGYDAERQKFKLDTIAQLAGQELIDLFTLAKIAWGNNFSMTELFERRCYALSDAVSDASRERVNQLLDAA